MSQHQRIQWIQVAEEIEEVSTACSSTAERYWRYCCRVPSMRRLRLGHLSRVSCPIKLVSSQ